MIDVLNDAPFEGCRAAIASRYRAGESAEDLAADYNHFGFTLADIRAITEQADQ